ncbi:MAG: DoxX family protein [Acidobacteria bacterium]|nr:DoxX family protein [Acidobacteriota bacterium]
MKAPIENCFRWLNTGASSLQSPFLLLVRLYWGWQFIETGWGKVNNIGKVTAFFTTLGIPLPGLNAHLVAGLELVGGLLLILGLGARPIGFLLSINMLVAYITADREALLSFISDPDKFTAAAPFTFLVASLIVLIFGAGWFSMDSWIAWRRRPKTESAVGVQL